MESHWRNIKPWNGGGACVTWFSSEGDREVVERGESGNPGRKLKSGVKEEAKSRLFCSSPVFHQW